MANKLRVLTPQTTDGKTLQYGADEKPVYTESIVEITAKKDFERLNDKLPNHLKFKFEEFEEAEQPTVMTVVDTGNLDKVKSDLNEKQKALDEATTYISEKDKEIAELKQKLEAANAANAKKDGADKK